MAYKEYLIQQSVVHYGVAIFTLLLRTYVSPRSQCFNCSLNISYSFARWCRVGGFRNLAIGDWLMLIVVPILLWPHGIYQQCYEQKRIQPLSPGRVRIVFTS
jgi:hypothetical protein